MFHFCDDLAVGDRAPRPLIVVPLEDVFRPCQTRHDTAHSLRGLLASRHKERHILARTFSAWPRALFRLITCNNACTHAVAVGGREFQALVLPSAAAKGAVRRCRTVGGCGSLPGTPLSVDVLRRARVSVLPQKVVTHRGEVSHGGGDWPAGLTRTDDRRRRKESGGGLLPGAGGPHATSDL